MAYDFPSSPTDGQVSNGYTWSAAKGAWMSGGSSVTGVIQIKKFVASGTYVPDPSLSYAIVECWGGGGGGGGVSTGTATTSVIGTGGGAGSYSRSVLTAAQIGASKAIVIGAGGASQVAGGATTFGGTLVTANGGLGGAPNVFSGATAGGVPGIGDVAIAGATSLPAAGDISNVQTITAGGAGGSSAVGVGGLPGFTSSSVQAGSGGIGNASGGGGASSNRTTGSAAGGSGTNGIIIITEYCYAPITGSAAAKKNYVINGAMQVSQENGATAGTTTVYYPVDMFYTALSHAGTQTTQQVASVTPGGSPNRLRVTATVADASVAAGDYSLLLTEIEGLRVADLRLGSVSAKTVTLRFGVKAPAGTYCVALRNEAFNRTYIAEYVISSGEANTDVVKSVTISLDTGGTWTTANTAGLRILWSLMCGSTNQQTANVWHAGSFYATSSQFNFMGTAGNVFELFDVSLTEGTVAPTYQVPDYASELALCKRYYQRYGGETLYDAAVSVYAPGVNPFNAPMMYFQEMRIAPSPVFVGTWAFTNGNAIAHAIKSKSTILFTITALAAGYASYYNNTTTSFMALNARL